MSKLRVVFPKFANAPKILPSLMSMPLWEIRICSIFILRTDFKVRILCSIIIQMDNTACIIQFLLYLHSYSKIWTKTNTESQQLKLNSLDRSQNMYLKRK
jgi:hypothetical protein